MKIAFLGLGKMGTPLARLLLDACHEVTVWNRSRERAEALAADGASVAATPAEAVRAVDAVLTMLFDDAAHEQVIFGPDGVLEALKPGALHISMSTISVALSERLTAEHARRGQRFVAAPVFGRPSVAEAGKLWIVVAGAADAVAAGAALAGHQRDWTGAAPGARPEAGREFSDQRHDSLAGRGLCVCGGAGH
jgi:3-hydroxyisobutyrate dehydrogenase-like beta-hydroxyacid dehydrogenase